MNISLIIINQIQNKYDNNIFNNKKRNTTYYFRRINLWIFIIIYNFIFLYL